ncbi:unnamed protein product (macronuclear) [Paramecium tetraurelia]|uniref:Transmembrane protein n=1 Tax=Paramecium tetraurelia TaxID=5888 RepID=A0BD65_PARTE|nr:uncharacterized protein GSPATT00004576001 [Paramecium tetraurelia]CAK56482.1 unnamed protein product [Paramecium tetraurelia]|eukprot:XP_001423880.1 hypothetical protein (macronuclear) [Paramecium tetraurelia strain d4-2]
MILNELIKKKYWYINKNWRVRHQILTIQIASLILVFALLTAIIIVGQILVQKSIKESADVIFIRQTKAELNSVWMYKNNILTLLNSASNQIQLINKLNQYFQSTSFNTVDPVQCLNKENTNDTYCYSSSFCFGIFNTTCTQDDIEELQIVYKITSILTQFRNSIDNTQALYFSHANYAQFYTLSQGFYFKPGFKPHSRPWYTFHRNQTTNNTNLSQLIYGNPYQIFLTGGGIRIAMTSNLISLNQEIEGVIAKDIDFNQTKAFKYQDDSTTVTIINLKGQVIYSRLYDNPNQTIFSITDQNYSGFNQTDFEQIVNYHNQLNYSSSCSNIQEYKNVLCRYNSKLNDSSIIQTATINGTPYILLLVKNTNYLKLLQYLQLSLIVDQYNSIIQQHLIIFLSITLLIIFLTYMVSFLLLNQLNIIIMQTNAHLFNKQVKSFNNGVFRNKYYFQSTEVSNLLLSVIGLMHNINSNKKNEECLHEEQKQFPQIIKMNKMVRLVIKGQIGKMQNRLVQNQYNFDNSDLKIFINYFRQTKNFT